jgi:hypothetical protein
VTAILKTTEQLKTLQTHMNQLAAQIDILADTVTSTKKAISRSKMASETGSKTADTLVNDLSSKVTSLAFSLATKEKELATVRDSLAQSFSAIEVLRELFAVSEFQEIMLFPALRHQEISSKTVVSYLAEVDEGVTSLCTWLSFIRGKTQYRLQPKLFPTGKPLTVKVGIETDLEEGKDVLTEAEIRTRVRLTFDQRLQSALPKRHSVTPH